MGEKEVRQVGWGQVIESLEGQKEYFIFDALFNGKPVESVEKGDDVFTGPGVSEEVSLWRE